MSTEKLSIPLEPSDAEPIATAIVASGILQEQAERTRLQQLAVRRLGKVALKSFTEIPLDLEQAEELETLYDETTYWHGTGRYQRHGGKTVDVLRSVAEQGGIRPNLDPFEPELGLVTTTSLATPRLYARAYADMHDPNPKQLNRLLDNQYAATFYVVRPTMHHSFSQAAKHEDGLFAGLKAFRRESDERHAAVPQMWSRKITNARVNPMLAYRQGSDIEGNYPVLIGINKNVQTIPTSKAIAETREARTKDFISASDITHFEVPIEKVAESEELLRKYGINAPVVAIEAMEQHVAKKPFEDVLLGNN